MPVPGPLELIIVLVIALIILGPGKLPDVGAALGKGIREFRRASTDLQDAARVDPTPAAPPNPPAAASVSPPPAGEPTTQPKP
jgi:sec-independent protein translocase protein TatA